MRIAAFDIGSKRVGVASSDALGISINAQGVFEYKTEEELIARIKKRAEELEAGLVVVGLPLNMDGSAGEAAKKILRLVEKLKKEISVPVETFDERLTTVAAEDFLIEADLSRKKRKKIIDSAAAQVILRDYLSTRKQRGNIEEV